jgi:hypothetical protein
MLTKTQKRAAQKLTDEWQSAYSLHERIVTLEVLVTKGIAQREIGPGALWTPRTAHKYRRDRRAQT